MKIEQVSVFIENKAGRLAAILEVLEKRGISVEALSVIDTAEFGIVRMIFPNVSEGMEALQSAGITARTDLVVSTEIPNVPGGLLQSVVKPLADAGVNIHYLYIITDPSTNKGMAIIKTADLEKTESILNSR
jgi:hypothetical protein